MSGNVWEWCEDDSTAWIDNDNRSQPRKCLRGSSWGSNPCDCRSAFRINYNRRADRDYNIGFRVVCDN
jgi:formylglycine-generating enzyme required for sulfatase activity